TYADVPATSTATAPGMFSVETSVGVKPLTVPGTDTLSVFWLIVTTQLPGLPENTRPSCSPKLHTFRSLDKYFVLESAVRSSTVFPSIRVTFQFSCTETTGLALLVRNVIDGGATVEVAVAFLRS